MSGQHAHSPLVNKSFGQVSPHSPDPSPVSNASDAERDIPHQIAMAEFSLSNAVIELTKLAEDDANCQLMIRDWRGLERDFMAFGQLITRLRRQIMVAAE